MKITSIEEEVKVVTEWRNASNEYQLRVFDLLFRNETEELWRKPEYYRDSPELLKYKDMSFHDLLKGVFNFSNPVYCKMRDRLRNISDWRTLYIKHGWDHGMACLINRTQNERTTILDAIETGDKRPINMIWRHHFPKQKAERTESASEIKTKYDKLKMKYTRLEKLYDKLREEHILLKKKTSADIEVALNGIFS